MFEDSGSNCSFKLQPKYPPTQPLFQGKSLGVHSTMGKAQTTDRPKYGARDSSVPKLQPNFISKEESLCPLGISGHEEGPQEQVVLAPLEEITKDSKQNREM